MSEKTYVNFRLSRRDAIIGGLLLGLALYGLADKWYGCASPGEPVEAPGSNLTRFGGP